jgi:predicted nucleic acid-binding protein
MGLILDSSVLIQAERTSETVAQLLKKVVNLTGDQETALSAIALVELAHGIHRANTMTHPGIAGRRASLSIYATNRTLGWTSRCGPAKARHENSLPRPADRLTALHLGYAVVTGNPRHFQMIPNLLVKLL